MLSHAVFLEQSRIRQSRWVLSPVVVGLFLLASMIPALFVGIFLHGIGGATLNTTLADGLLAGDVLGQAGSASVVGLFAWIMMKAILKDKSALVENLIEENRSLRKMLISNDPPSSKE